MDRIELYKQSKLLRTFITGLDGETKDVEYSNSESIYEIIKEVVFDFKDGKSLTNLIVYVYNKANNRLELSNLLEGSFKDDDDIISELLMCKIYNVPVVPNNKTSEIELLRLYKKMYDSGFAILDEGKKKKYKIVDDHNILNYSLYDSKINYSQLSYADFEILKEKLAIDIRKYDSAYILINYLKNGIDELEKILNADRRNENDIQRCISKYAVLFGTEYIKVIPKFKFGSDYETDYVLQKNDGLYEVVELEASTHKLFTKNGNPSSHLIHAEQQIFDWFEWLERNNPYIRENLNDLYSPTAFIVIGRTKDLSETDIKKLRRRNIILKNYVKILTYDDLLKRARALLDLLTNESNHS
ncbi:Shedu anti-phage system protein SduA domain-containing protein [Streptococcus uberis]|uniref:Shedu anti-phage system protein SduA domain-containing protein n=1 Tax=Streptococcus uberis TaxID=1349 RepID=UPI0038915FE6